MRLAPRLPRLQNLAYDAGLRRWFMGVYRGKKPDFPNFTLFAVDARARPVRGDLIGVPGREGRRWERGLLLPLAPDGLQDAATGLRGWEQKADVGIQPVGRGLFYLAANAGGPGRQTGTIALMRWSGDTKRPFVPVTQDSE